jgi:hypothetical protein
VAMAARLVLMMMADRKVESHHRARRAIITHRRADRRGVDNRGRMINHRRGRILIDDRLMNDDRLGVNDRGLRWNDDLLHRLMDDHRGGLMHDHGRRLIDYWSGLHVNRWRSVNRLRLEGLRQQQARSHTCHNFTSGCPFLIASFHARERGSQHSQRCCYH